MNYNNTYKKDRARKIQQQSTSSFNIGINKSATEQFHSRWGLLVTCFASFSMPKPLSCSELLKFAKQNYKNSLKPKTLHPATRPNAMQDGKVITLINPEEVGDCARRMLCDDVIGRTLWSLPFTMLLCVTESLPAAAAAAATARASTVETTWSNY